MPSLLNNPANIPRRQLLMKANMPCIQTVPFSSIPGEIRNQIYDLIIEDAFRLLPFDDSFSRGGTDGALSVTNPNARAIGDVLRLLHFNDTFGRDGTDGTLSVTHPDARSIEALVDGRFQPSQGLRMADKRTYDEFNSRLFSGQIFYIPRQVFKRYPFGELHKVSILRHVEHLCIDVRSCLLGGNLPLCGYTATPDHYKAWIDWCEIMSDSTALEITRLAKALQLHKLTLEICNTVGQCPILDRIIKDNVVRKVKVDRGCTLFVGHLDALRDIPVVCSWMEAFDSTTLPAMNWFG